MYYHSSTIWGDTFRGDIITGPTSLSVDESLSSRLLFDVAAPSDNMKSSRRFLEHGQSIVSIKFSQFESRSLLSLLSHLCCFCIFKLFLYNTTLISIRSLYWRNVCHTLAEVLDYFVFFVEQISLPAPVSFSNDDPLTLRSLRSHHYRTHVSVFRLYVVVRSVKELNLISLFYILHEHIQLYSSFGISF